MQKHLVYFGIAGLLLLTADSSCLAQSGAELYKSKCQMCHAADGSGNTPAGKAMKARPFNSPDVMKESDADLIASSRKAKTRCLRLRANSRTRRSQTSWRISTRCRNSGEHRRRPQQIEQLPRKRQT